WRKGPSAFRDNRWRQSSTLRREWLRKIRSSGRGVQSFLGQPHRLPLRGAVLREDVNIIIRPQLLEILLELLLELPVPDLLDDSFPGVRQRRRLLGLPRLQAEEVERPGRFDRPRDLSGLEREDRVLDLRAQLAP